MLHDIYFQIGLGGTFAVSVLMVFTGICWVIALAGTVVQPMGPARRAVLLAVLTLFPPVSLGVVVHTIIRARAEYRDPVRITTLDNQSRRRAA